VLAKLYCASSTSDTRAGFNHIFEMYPGNPVYGIGLSLGASLLGNVICEYILLVCSRRRK